MNDHPSHEITRRDSLKALGAIGVGTVLASPLLAAMNNADTPLFRISLAQWSLHKLFFANEIDNLDFASEARSMGFDAIEYVNAFFKDKAEDKAYLRQMNARASDNGVTQLLIMCDGEGALGDADEGARGQSVENHKKWVHAAKTLGCHSIRVNAASSGSYEEQQKLAADGLRRLTEFAEPYGINVIVENHGGYSSNGAWLSGVMKRVDHPMCGTLPDFGNFCMDWSRSDEPDAWYDRYKGTGELMPFAKAVSAKSHEFDADGNETGTDYRRMMRIVLDSGYRGWVGVEYEGSTHSPRDGSKLTKQLLETIRDEMSA
ncbi:MAG: sugar phosphate isomerase/epimerase family protein [Phycisphaerales bacterium JB052]